MRRRLLPWDYAVRNLFRRPSRSMLTLVAMTTVVLLIFVVIGFVRGLEGSLQISGDPDVVLVYSVGAEENIENSSVAGRIPGLLTASLDVVQSRFGVVHSSPELFLGTRVSDSLKEHGSMGLVRGVTTAAPLVRRRVRITEGRWPSAGEVIVGHLAAAKLGFGIDQLSMGREIFLEGRSWKIAGHFTAEGSAFESEIWCPLDDLQQSLKRQDVSVVALLLKADALPMEVELFCKERTDLELQAIGEAEYYASLQKFYRPVRILAWVIVALVAGSGIFAGFNTMYGAVMGRVRELAMLQAVGYRRVAILISLIQEAMVLASAASLLAGVMALVLFNGVAVRFTMGAFALRIDSVAILLGCGVGLLLGIFGAIPAGIRALRMPVVESLKAI
ncbi:ABC transporter permease [bacterium]|nr:ABC transporter permease [bacterium]